MLVVCRQTPGIPLGWVTSRWWRVLFIVVAVVSAVGLVLGAVRGAPPDVLVRRFVFVLVAVADAVALPAITQRLHRGREAALVEARHLLTAADDTIGVTEK